MILMDGGGGVELWSDGELIDLEEVGGEVGDPLSMDYEALIHILEEPNDPQSGFQMLTGVQNLDAASGVSVTSFDNSNNAGSSAVVSDDAKIEPYSLITCPMQPCSANFRGSVLPLSGGQAENCVAVLQSEIPSCSTASSAADGESNHVSDTSNLDLNFLFGKSETQFRYVGGNGHCEDASHGLYVNNLDGKFGHGDALIENNSRSSEPEYNFHRHADLPLKDAEVSLHNVATTQSTFCYNSDCNAEFGGQMNDLQYGINSANTYHVDSPSCYFGSGFDLELFPNNEIGGFQTESACSASELSMIDHYDDKAHVKSQCLSGNFLSNADDKLADDKSLGVSFSCVQSAISKNHPVKIEDEKIAEVVGFRSMMCQSDEMTNEVNRIFSYSDESSPILEEESKQSSSGVSSSMLSQTNVIYMKDERGDMNFACARSQVNGVAGEFPLDGIHLNSITSKYYLSCAEELNANKHLNYFNQEIDNKPIQPKHLGHLSSVSPESIQSNLSSGKSNVDDDSDVCIIEDMSHPASSHQSFAFGKANAPSHDSAYGDSIHYTGKTNYLVQHSAYGDSIHYSGVGRAKHKANDERFIFQAALQDLSQPKSEASLPEDVLAVPLLRHQRIALSWMVQKETNPVYCSGGILADDQGLGKTVSTIALILKERSPSVKADLPVVKKEEFETLNLDEDDDEVGQIKEETDDHQVTANLLSEKRTNTSGKSKGRPKAGTLVVCPTSVLRQWAEELHKKVTSKANLSVLVYHGSNRTKDPCEVAKYDVVLTTYSIVSMEVPKQPVAGEEDDEKIKVEGDDVASLGLSSCKKRKYPPSSDRKGPRSKKVMNAALFDSVARPLAKVEWFRVVLDEAQSIKNHRTQVARACWGLRAKRRWCLSGTPIQNAIDDLYSYFRFLKYDPYSVYNVFCSALKIPVQKSPTNGYKKLQTVLRTIMLRRTKATQIDGKPIINLPPKVVELKKVDFTDEERDFYTQLERESRAQFREFEHAGTVKQNYVNILLMLLRLRQACDHPLLVRGMDSKSLGRSSLEMAKKLPKEKLLCLLNCLEASLAICGICNDPPEDAVVSICGHVFCNQCICEHLTGDDNLCPTPKCKTRLNMSSVLSKATLNSSLSDQPAAEDGSGSELGGATDSYPEGLPFDSTKIRAALEVLKSLNKPQDCRSANGSLEKSFDGNVTCPENLGNSGYSVNGDADRGNVPLDENVNGSVKVVGEKAIVFSQWTRMLDLLEACLKSSSVQYRRLDGTMSVVARDKAVKDFNTLPEVSVMIMSLKAASLGLNMVAACHVLLLDLWWNPTTEDQAIDRAHRIGQTRPVTVLRLTVKDTVEDRILALQQKKREMVASAFGEDETGSRQSRLTVEDLRYLFMA